MRLPSREEFKLYFPGFRSCVIKNFLLMVYAIIEGRSCSLYKCAELIPGEAVFESSYKRLLRFVRMRHAEQFCLGVGYLIMALFPREEAFYAVIDRTNWKLGVRPINVLFVGILLWDRLYVPLLWEPLESHGNSTQQQRMALLERFCTLWQSPRQLVLLADREFIGRQWIQWLRKRHIGLVIRLRENDYLDEVADSLRILEGLVPQRIRRCVRKHGYFVAKVTLAGCDLYYVALPDTKHKYKVASFLSHRGDAQWVQQAYRRRWYIEVFFKQVKRDGFNLEDLGVTQIDRVRVMVAAVSFAYALALREGFIEQAKRPIPLKRNRKTGQTWSAVSLFRYGYRWLRRKMRTAKLFIAFIRQIIQRTIRNGTTSTTRFFTQSVQ